MKNKSLNYIAHIRLPTEKAHGLQIMKTCSALAELGFDITLHIPNWNHHSTKQIFGFYQLSEDFRINKVRAPKLFVLGAFGFFLQSLYFAWKTSGALRSSKERTVYTRDESVACIFAMRGFAVIYEMHDVRKSFLQKIALRKAKCIITISHGLANYCETMCVSKEKIAVIPDAVNIEQFIVHTPVDELRKKLHLPPEKKVVLYAGHLYAWKGAQILAEAAKDLPSDIVTIFVGGTPWDVQAFKAIYQKYTNMKIIGQQPHAAIPMYLKAADLLVLPNSGKHTISKYYTSPIKLFEYMASDRPILAADLPSIREILNQNNAFFFEADHVDDLREKIKFALDNKSKADILVSQACHDVKKYTWHERAKQIDGVIEQTEKDHRHSDV